MKPYFIGLTCLTCAVFLLNGCGEAEKTNGPYPPPGSFIVLSVTALEDEPRNLLPNGNFKEWYAGLDFPTDFSAPSDPDVSITKSAIFGQFEGAPKGYGAKQTWLTSDIKEPPSSQWGTTVELEANSTYQFLAYADLTGECTVVVQAWDLNIPSRPRLIDPNVAIAIEQGVQRIEGTFTTRVSGAVRLCSYLDPASPTTGSVTWYDWSLFKHDVAPDEEPTPALSSTPIENALDQLRKQVEVYGGHNDWSQKIQPARDAFGELETRLEESGSNATMFQNKFALRLSEARFFLDSDNLILDMPTEGLPKWRPFFVRLVEIKEALQARGIEFVCVPIPSRVHMYPEKAILNWESDTPTYVGYLDLVQSMLERNYLAINVSHPMESLRADGVPVYFDNGIGLSGAAHRALGMKIAQVLHDSFPDQYDALQIEYNIQPRQISLRPWVKRSVDVDGEPEEIQTVFQVRDDGNKLLDLSAPSPILALGRIAHDFRRDSASWAFHLAGALGTPVTLYEGAYKDEEVLWKLLDEEAVLANTKAIVFCFSEEKLLSTYQ